MKVGSFSIILLGLAVVSSFAQWQMAGAGASDGLSAVIIGSGSPLFNIERAGPSVLIRYQTQNILVDMGNDAQANLAKLNFNYRQLNGIFLTHHHLDHNEEFIPVFIHTLLGGNKFQVVGPTPTKEYATATSLLYQKDIDYRLGRGGREYASVKDNFSVKELNGGESFTVGEIKVSTARVNHTIETVAYRFDAGGKSIVVSGDLTYSASLSELAKNADVLIIDSGAVVRKDGESNRPNGRPNARGTASNRRGQNQNGQGGRPQWQSAGARAHSSLNEVGKMASEANARKLVLTHFTPGSVDEEAITQALARIFKGTILFAKDLFEIQVLN